MSDHTGIEWTDATWNPVVGCTPVSPGCLNCYAATMAKRLGAMGQERYVGLTTAGEVRKKHVGGPLNGVVEVHPRHIFNGTVRTVPEADARAEGTALHAIDCVPQEKFRVSFGYVWDRINGRTHPWPSNPWVWVLEFDRVEGVAA